MKLVAVSQRVEVLPEREERRDALDQNMAAFLCAAGVLPAPVPNGLTGPDADGRLLKSWLREIEPEGLVLTGGDDFGVHPERDRTEDMLLSFADFHRLPVLGICRGMQALGVAAGATLRAVTGHTRSRHTITGALSGVVNSFHAFALADCPKGFDVIARSDDGEIEAIRGQSFAREGWMWHPERSPACDPRDVEGARALFGGKLQ